MSKQAEIQERLAKLHTNLVGIPGRKSALEAEAEEIRSAMAANVLEGEQSSFRRRLREIADDLVDVGEDEQATRSAIQTAEADLAAIVLHSWRTRDGIYGKKHTELECEFRQAVVVAYRATESIFEMLRERQNAAQEAGVDPAGLGWNSWRKLGSGYVVKVLARLGKLRLDVSPGRTALNWLQEDLKDELERAS